MIEAAGALRLPTAAPAGQDVLAVWHYRQPQEVELTGRQLWDLVDLRNELLKERVDTLPEAKKPQQFKRMLHSLLGKLAFLKQYPLFSRASPQINDNEEGYLCHRHVGFHNDFALVRLKAARDVPLGHVFMLNQKTQQVLDLHPFYLFVRCTTCGQMHLFRFVGKSDRESHIEYVALGHTLVNQPAYGDLEQLLHRGNGRPQSGLSAGLRRI